MNQQTRAHLENDH